MNDQLDDLIKKASEQSAAKKEEQKETPKVEEKPKDIPKPPESKTIFERLKAKGINAEKDDDIENHIESQAKRLAELEETYRKEKSEYETKLKGFGEVDPMSFFSSPEAYKREQLKKQFPEISIDVADRIITSDLSKLTAEERIILSIRSEEPSITDSEARAILESKYGAEEDRTDAQKALMKLDARDAINKLDKFKASVKEPEKINTQAIREQQEKERTESLKKIESDWTSRVDEVVKSFDKFEVKDKNGDKEEVLFSMNVEGDFINRMKKDIPKYFVDNQIPFNEENAKWALSEMYETYARENRVKMMKAYAKQYADKAVDEVRQEYAGMKPIDKSTKPAEQANVITDAQKRKMLYGDLDNSVIKPVQY